MIIKRNFNPVKVLQYVRFELMFSAGIAILVFTAFMLKVNNVVLPFSVSAILGSALAIFIAFRNNSAYSRWWEARSQWSAIMNASRVLARLVITFTDSHSHQANYDPERSEKFKKESIYKIIAWGHSLRLHLRRQQDWHILKSFLNEEEYQTILRSHNKPNYLHLMMGRDIYKAMANGTLGGFDSFQMEGQLLAMANAQAGSERIKNTPLLRQYDYFTRLFLYTFMLLLPFSLIKDFSSLGQTWMMMPVSIIISFVFAIISKVGEVNENPFENKITDVPLTAICNSIERELLEMLGEKDLPAKVEPQNGYLY